MTHIPQVSYENYINSISPIILTSQNITPNNHLFIPYWPNILSSTFIEFIVFNHLLRYNINNKNEPFYIFISTTNHLFQIIQPPKTNFQMLGKSIKNQKVQQN